MRSQSDAQTFRLCLNNLDSSYARDKARIWKQLTLVERELSEIREQLYWKRLQDLIHTPSWRYRVRDVAFANHSV